MYCVNCGSPVEGGWTFCAQCGKRTLREHLPAPPQTAIPPAATSSKTPTSVATTLGSFVYWFIHASRAKQVLLVLGGLCILGIMIKMRFAPKSFSPEQQQTSSPAPEANHPPEIRISDFMLQPRSKIEDIIGKPVRQSECQDAPGEQYEYSNDSYLCVDHGRVILLSYVLHRIPSNGNNALDMVGLHTDVQPYAPYGTLFNVWSAEKGNPLTVGKMYAHQVTAMVTQVGQAGSSAVEVDMTGATQMNESH